MSKDSYNRLRRNTKYLETQFAHFSLPEGNFNQWHDYEKHYSQPVQFWLCPPLSLLTQRKTTNHNTSDWWHQSVNVVGSYHTRFGPQIRNDTYLEYEAFAKRLV